MSEPPLCEKCGSEKMWVECDQCLDGYNGHDCGEIPCCCLDPEENLVCDICGGQGGWWACLECADPEWVANLVQEGRI